MRVFRDLVLKKKMTSSQPKECVPTVLYGKRDTTYKTLYEGNKQRLEEGCLGIRVFYFNETNDHCDHFADHRKEWLRVSPPNERSVEAGTVVALTDYNISINGSEKKHYLVVIRWDCGLLRAYTEEDLKSNVIRVFDLGPTGEENNIIFNSSYLAEVARGIIMAIVIKFF